MIRSSSTIVYGNLGRHLKRVLEDLRPFQTQTCIIVYKEAIDNVKELPCDLLVWLEPPFHARIETPPRAGRLLVFTSHLLFETELDIVTHIDDLVERPLERVFCVECQSVKRDAFAKIILLERTKAGGLQFHEMTGATLLNTLPPPVVAERSFVVVDLSDCTNDPLETYLCLLDVMDNGSLRRSSRCLVCFREGVLEPLLKRLSECKSRLMEVKFRGGNVTYKPYLSKYFLLDMEFVEWEDGK